MQRRLGQVTEVVSHNTIVPRKMPAICIESAVNPLGGGINWKRKMQATERTIKAFLAFFFI